MPLLSTYNFHKYADDLLGSLDTAGLVTQTELESSVAPLVVTDLEDQDSVIGPALLAWIGDNATAINSALS